MRLPTQGAAISVLTWTLGLVVLAQSVHFALSAGPSLHAGLGWVEAAGALLFLLAPARAAGSVILLLTFAVALVAHIAQGEFEVGALLIYAAAVIVCSADRRAPAGARS